MLEFLGAAGAGAADALQEQIAQQLRQQMVEQQAEEARQRLALDQQRLNEQVRGNAADEAFRGRQEAAANEQRAEVKRVGELRQRGRSNMAGVVGMGLDPQTAKRELAFTALNNDVDIPGGVMDAVEPPQVERDPLADYEARKKIDLRYAPRSTGPAAPREQQWVIRNGQPVPIQKGTAQAGDMPYDPVAARQTQGPSSPDQGREVATEVARVARSLRDAKGFNRAFGVLDSKLPTLNQDTADAEAMRNTLTSLLTLENMGLMKGVLSDSDMKVLRQASSLLGNEAVGEVAARAELDRLIPIMEKVAGIVGGVEEPRMGRTGAQQGGGPAVGQIRVINGQRAQWDGRGWLPVK
jgi:hypothetical protein